MFSYSMYYMYYNTCYIYIYIAYNYSMYYVL